MKAQEISSLVSGFRAGDRWEFVYLDLLPQPNHISLLSSVPKFLSYLISFHDFSPKIEKRFNKSTISLTHFIDYTTNHTLIVGTTHYPCYEILKQIYQLEEIYENMF